MVGENLTEKMRLELGLVRVRICGMLTDDMRLELG